MTVDRSEKSSRRWWRAVYVLVVVAWFAAIAACVVAIWRTW